MNNGNAHNGEINCPVSISVYTKIWQKALDKEHESITMTAIKYIMNSEKGGQNEYALNEQLDYFVANLGYITKELFHNRGEAQQESIRFRDLFKRNRERLLAVFENKAENEFPTVVEAYQFFVSQRTELVLKASQVEQDTFSKKHKETIPPIHQLIAYFSNTDMVRQDLESFYENSACETVVEFTIMNRSKQSKIRHPFLGTISLPTYLNRYMVSKMIHSPFSHLQSLQKKLLLELLERTGLLDDDEESDSVMKKREYFVPKIILNDLEGFKDAAGVSKAGLLTTEHLSTISLTEMGEMSLRSYLLRFKKTKGAFKEMSEGEVLNELMSKAGVIRKRKKSKSSRVPEGHFTKAQLKKDLQEFVKAAGLDDINKLSTHHRQLKVQTSLGEISFNSYIARYGYSRGMVSSLRESLNNPTGVLDALANELGYARAAKKRRVTKTTHKEKRDWAEYFSDKETLRQDLESYAEAVGLNDIALLTTDHEEYLAVTGMGELTWRVYLNRYQKAFTISSGKEALDEIFTLIKLKRKRKKYPKRKKKE